jgi:SUMO ligase MMS21 Smc5/6 complex component
MLMHVTCIFLTCVALSSAVKLNVASSGGNASSPLMYGIMFEVRDDNNLLQHLYTVTTRLLSKMRALTDFRTSITVEMEVCMLN